jgi:hypothetical protein
MPKTRAFSSAIPEDSTPPPNPLEGVTFTLDEVEFRCEGHMAFLDMSDMARRMAELPTTDLDDLRKLDPMAAAQVMGSMSSSLLMALGQAEYRRFKQHCHDHHTPDDAIAEVMAFINEAIEESVAEHAGRPTSKPQPSSSGPAETGGRTSRIISLQRGDVTVIGEDGQPRPVMRDHQEAGRQPAAAAVKELGGTQPPKPRGRRHTA